MQTVSSRPSVTIVLTGVSGAGKSTVSKVLVERLGWPSAEADDFHSAANVAKMSSGHPLTDEDRWPWLRAIAAWIGDREAAAENVVLTCSALRRTYRDVLRAGHPSVCFAHLLVERAILEHRMERRRGHYMPASLLDSQLATLEPLDVDEPGIVVAAAAPPERIADDIVEWLQL